MKDDNSGQMIDCNSWNCRRWSLISQSGRQSPPVGFLGRCLHDCVVDIVCSVLTIANHQGRFKEVIKVTLWTKRQQTEVSFLVSNSKEFCDCYFCDHPLREKCEWEEKRCRHFEKGGKATRRWRNCWELLQLSSSCFSPCCCLSPWSKPIVRQVAGLSNVSSDSQHNAGSTLSGLFNIWPGCTFSCGHF